MKKENPEGITMSLTNGKSGLVRIVRPYVGLVGAVKTNTQGSRLINRFLYSFSEKFVRDGSYTPRDARSWLEGFPERFNEFYLLETWNPFEYSADISLVIKPERNRSVSLNGDWNRVLNGLGREGLSTLKGQGYSISPPIPNWLPKDQRSSFSSVKKARRV